MTSFGAVLVLSFVLFSIWPFFDSISILFVIFPFSDVLCSVRVSISSISVCLIIQPLTFVDISIGMIQDSLTICFVVSPLSDVFAPISPGLSPIALSHTHLPLSFVSDAIVELNRPKFCDFIVFESRLNELVILCSLSPILQVGISIIYFTISIGFWLHLSPILLGLRTSIFFLSLLLFNSIILSLSFGLMIAFLLVFDLIMVELLILCSFIVTVLALEAIAL